MKPYKIPIIIERYESVSVNANTLDEAIQMVEGFSYKDIEKHMTPHCIFCEGYQIPKHSHINIDWDLVENYNPAEGGV